MGTHQTRRSVSQAVVLNTCNDREQAVAQISGRIDCISVHPSEADADGNHHQADHQRGEVCARWLFNSSVIANASSTEQASADQLIEKSRLGQSGKSRKSGEDAGCFFQLRVDLPECGKIIPKHDRRRGKCSGSLRDRVRHDLAPGELAKHGLGDGHGRIQMSSGNFVRRCKRPL